MPLDATPHPGTRIKSEVIPSGMSVTQAAKLMGVGRPALSNLLNGKAALTAKMATRLEKAFNRPRNELLQMQAEFEAAQAKKEKTPTEAKAYVPPFLGITANQIEAWADHNVLARSRLSVFLRVLVHSTGIDLRNVDFPGNDDSERPGWDGLVEAGQATPWIPIGQSGWEFEVNNAVKTKAEKDYKKSVKAVSDDDRRGMTYVFVTPRRWPGKNAWVKSVKEKGHWKDVRAYDASDLEQWLEQSIPGQVWFANETNISAHDVRSLDKCWKDWANVAEPPLTGALFGTAIAATKRMMASRMSNPPDGPTVIAADSTEEALAFLSQLLGELGGEELAAFRDRVLVFDKPNIFPRLAQGARSFIPVVFTREVERELGPYARSMHSIVLYPRNASSIEPHFVLEPANYEIFSKALVEMGKDRDEIYRLDNESGRSLTVLRRRLAIVDAVRTPQWAADHGTAASLVPFLFAGAWQSTNDADRKGLSLLADGTCYDDLERQLQILAQLDDAPVWSIGAYRGVVSKIDLLYAIAGVVSAEDLKHYYSLARMVLGEDDPALDLSEDKRWTASIYGKKRDFSKAFREGICESLVLLAVHGSHLFRRRLGIDPESEATRVVRDLLPTPLTTRILQANDNDLRTYAEAAPTEFLSILERDLKTDAPATLTLMRPVTPGLFGQGPSRTGLLWALEGLAWNTKTLPRAVFILAQLAQVEINDNWINKPIHSLEAIFRAWMPQTAAGYEERLGLLKQLAKRFPGVAWRICISQFGNGPEIGDYSHKPRWRSDGYGFGEPIRDRQPVEDFIRETLELALSWKDHTAEMLAELVKRLHALGNRYQDRLWDVINKWATTKATDYEKAALREHIRVSVLSRHAALQAKRNKRLASATKKAKAAYAALEPSNLINKHAWLFRDAWIEESADEVEDIERLDYRKREEQIEQLRLGALREILEQFGLPGLLQLAERGNASWQVGYYAARELVKEADLIDLLRRAVQRMLEDPETANAPKTVIRGALQAVQDACVREHILKTIATDLPDEQFAELLVLAPFNRTTWVIVDTLSDIVQSQYWSEVAPSLVRDSDSDSEVREVVERLLKSNRPRAAFSCVRFDLERLDAQVLFCVLFAIAKGGNEKPGEYMFDRYHIEQAFKQIDMSPGFTLDERAMLEFAFLEVLAQRWDDRPDRYGIPNLERYVEENPDVFVQAITWAYRRKDGGTDPPELQIPEDMIEGLARRGHDLLEAFERIPGKDESDEESKVHQLSTWVSHVRRRSAELSRSEIADICIGKVLANAPVGGDGVWPCEQVRQVMEEIQSEAIMEGAQTEVYNSRGVHFRGEGGDQERQLAEKYRRWSESLKFSHPFVSSMLLMELTETYEREASCEDIEAGIRRHLR